MFSFINLNGRAFAQAGGEPAGFDLISLLPLLILIGIIYFFVRRINKKTSEKEKMIKQNYDIKIQENDNSLNEKRIERIFLVHGHDEQTKHSVARFLEKIGPEVIILHEQPDFGSTVIEKFERNANVEFAVIIMTADDLGKSKENDNNLQGRARQNVILELGYFVGRLGRTRVCALIRGDVEIPSDYLGVVFVQLDDAGAWKLSLARELNASGVNINLEEMIRA